MTNHLKIQSTTFGVNIFVFLFLGLQAVQQLAKNQRSDLISFRKTTFLRSVVGFKQGGNHPISGFKLPTSLELCLLCWSCSARIPPEISPCRRSCGCLGNAWRAVADLREWQVAFGWSEECRHQQLSWSVRAQLPMFLDPCFVNEMLSPAMCWMCIFLLMPSLCNVKIHISPLCACMSYSTSPLKLTNRTWKMMVGGWISF